MNSTKEIPLGIVNLAHSLIVQLANVCDGAHNLDGQGFDKSDVSMGKQIASIRPDMLCLPYAQAACRMVVKYHRQLDEKLVEEIRPYVVTETDLDDEYLGDEVDEFVEAEITAAEEASEPITLQRPIQQELTLTDEQQLALNKLLEFIKEPLATEFRLGGYAGTGKTTLIKTLLKLLRELKKRAIVCAFTGKAVNVLQRKGVASQTMHSLMYNFEETLKGEFSFTKKYRLEGEPDVIIIDEASMISVELYNNLLSFGKKCIFVGDPGQLEPVGDNPNLMSRTDFVLTKIHRQAELSPIITLASRVRAGNAIIISRPVEGLTIRSKRETITSPEFLKADQVICARNKTRQAMNSALRAYLVRPAGELIVNDKIICLRNNRNFGVFNGQIFFVKEIKRTDSTMQDVLVEDEIGKMYQFPVWRLPFQKEVDPKRDVVPKRMVYCDFGYVITCHKSQGSEWDNVIVYDEYMPPQVWSMARWRYTAITRAAKQLTYLI